MSNFFKISFLFLLIVGFISCKKTTPPDALFQLLDQEHTNIDFVNTIEETDSFNMYTFMNIYTGGGVAVGDVNNDGLEDIFFSGNRTSSKLYLNKGNLVFEDITEKAGLTTNRWCAGVSMIDINTDGYLDLYISVSGVGTDEERSNLLFENQHDGTFKEKAKNYGLADSGQVMHTSFFDYDKDGDLDAYMIINPVNYSLADVNHVKPKRNDGSDESTDRLYRNDNGKFIDVSTEAGILIEGYSLGVSTCDINGDDWPDIYVSNDFLTNDILYVNNQDGTFSNKIADFLDHSSFAGMGNDVSDFNNDGLPDIMVADMLPEDNLRRQIIIPAASYDKFQLTQKMGYEAQYTRNTLQLNNGDGTFSEIGQLAGIDKTDWSWSTLFADYDNDGDKDLMVTNGFLRDVGNLDYISYQRKNNTSPFGKREQMHQQRLEAIQDLGAAKINNYVFENRGDLRFEKRIEDWGLIQKTCSNGAAFSDLDNDGDLEMITNNVNDRAFIYENKARDLTNNHFLKIKLQGSQKNPQGIGVKIFLQLNDEKQYQQHNIFRGYESSVSQIIHFGLGEHQAVDELLIKWPDGKTEVLTDIAADQTLDVFYKKAKLIPAKNNSNPTYLFNETTREKGLNFLHQEKDFVDFKIQALLPHKHSQGGPGIAIADVNGDGLDDCYVGGSAGFAGQLFLQTKDGTFLKDDQTFDPEFEDMGCLFFDADQDGDVDLYIVSGSSEFLNAPNQYQDRLYLNDGKGLFSKSASALPENPVSGSSVSAADFDQDGDFDLFIAGRIIAGAYPSSPKSILLRNDSEKGKAKFTDITNQQLPNQGKLGLVTAALWTDFDNDNWLDLAIVGEWMPITFYKNENGNLSKAITIPASQGWWNSLLAADFDQDGDIDYMAGNLGLNTRHKASPEKPFCVYAADYDKNGRIDPVICHYIGEKSFIGHPRDQLISQINAMRVRFKTYEDYGRTTFAKSFTEEELERTQIFKSERFESSYIENLGEGNFKFKDFPVEAQFAPVFGMQSGDFNADGIEDVLLVGNSYATEVAIGNYDAAKGLLLCGDGQGNFSAQKANETGFLVDKDAKSLARITSNGEELLLVSSNADSLLAFSPVYNAKRKWVTFENGDQFALLVHKNGKRSKKEFYLGESYLTQSSAGFFIDEDIIAVEIIDIAGNKRVKDLSLDIDQKANRGSSRSIAKPEKI